MNLPAITKARFVRALRKLGFVLVHQKGSHQKWRHSDGRFVYVYMHSREDLRPSALRSILRDARVSEEEFLKAL
ncbi:MAG: type II toxin-antitoxin system HicA family toxin [Deltaproteobacteria bacterium]|nr:type II toxin-antitoxin system HicA family toxin [Deltaproteobacteria bacterium]